MDWGICRYGRSLRGLPMRSGKRVVVGPNDRGVRCWLAALASWWLSGLADAAAVGGPTGSRSSFTADCGPRTTRTSDQPAAGWTPTGRSSQALDPIAINRDWIQTLGPWLTGQGPTAEPLDQRPSCFSPGLEWTLRQLSARRQPLSIWRRIGARPGGGDQRAARRGRRCSCTVGGADDFDVLGVEPDLYSARIQLAPQRNSVPRLRVEKVLRVRRKREAIGLLQVQDSGIASPRRSTDAIFDRFFRQ